MRNGENENVGASSDIFKDHFCFCAPLLFLRVFCAFLRCVRLLKNKILTTSLSFALFARLCGEFGFHLFWVLAGVDAEL